MTRKEARLFMERWARVNRVTNEEARRATPEERLRQVNALYQSVKAFGWGERMRIGEDEVRARWRLLKEKLGAEE